MRFLLAISLALVAQSQTLAVTGVVKQPLSLSLDDLAKMPRATVETKSDGIAITYEGVWLQEVLKRAGMPTKPLLAYVVAEASDGYQVVFGGGELDPSITDSQILVADKADGKPLFGRDGNFRLLIPKDKRGARSVRLLTRLKVNVIDPVSPLKAKLPAPLFPADNPLTAAKAELGRHLFYDQRMSANGAQSCATCHRQELAFTDGKAVAVGSTGELHSRSSMSLVNCAYNEALTWSDPDMKSLESQALTPMFGSRPVEMGMAEHTFLNRAREDSIYQRLFADAFPGDHDPFTLWNVTKAIATFERTIISADSAYDRYRYGHDPSAISDAAKRGEVLFFSSTHGGCFQCHGGWNFSGPVKYEGQEDHRHMATSSRQRVPTLRNIAVTAPYGHDGRVPTLEKMVAFYAAGGRGTRGFQITPVETADLVEFLKTLTDESLLHDPRFGDPWR